MFEYDFQERRSSWACHDSLSYKSNATKSTTPQSTSSKEYEWSGYPEANIASRVYSNETNLRSASDHLPYRYRPHRPAFQSPPLMKNSLSYRGLNESGISCLTNSYPDFGLDDFDQTSDKENSPYGEGIPPSSTLRDRVLFSPPFARKESMKRLQDSWNDCESLSSPTAPHLAETDHSSFSHLDMDRKMPALHRKLSKENMRELSRKVTRQLSKNFDKELSFKEPSNQDSREDCRIEIAPGILKPLRGASYTWEAIRMGNISPTLCMPCDTQILCTDTVQYVICPVCRSVSGANESGVEDAVGLGFSFEDLDEWRREIRQGSAA